MNSQAQLHEWTSVLRQVDRPRYLAILRAPRNTRPLLIQLTNLHHTLSEISESVTEPMLGAIRFTWWREAIESAQYGNKIPAHPLIEALTPHIQSSTIDVTRLYAMIEARDCELDSQLLDTEARFFSYIDGTSGNLLQCWAKILMDSDNHRYHLETLNSLARAHTLLRLLKAIPYLAHHNLLRFPRDIMEAHSLPHSAAALAYPNEKVQLFTHHLLGKAQLCLSAIEPYISQLPAPFRVIWHFATEDATALGRVAYNPYHLKLAQSRPLRSVWVAMCA